MPPRRVTVLRTLAPNSIPLHTSSLPPSLSFLPRDSPPTFSLALFLARRAVSHSARRVSRRNFPGASRHTPLHHYYYRLHHHHCQPPPPPPPTAPPPPSAAAPTSTTSSATTTINPAAITFGASTFTSSNPDDVLPTARLRRTSLFFPDPTPFPRPFPPFIPILPLARAACHPILRTYPARFLLRFSFKFHPTFSTPIPPQCRPEPPPPPPPPSTTTTATLPRHTLYISRARGSFHPLVSLTSSLSHARTLARSLASCPGDARYVLKCATRDGRLASRGANFGAARHARAAVR